MRGRGGDIAGGDRDESDELRILDGGGRFFRGVAALIGRGAPLENIGEPCAPPPEGVD